MKVIKLISVAALFVSTLAVIAYAEVQWEGTYKGSANMSVVVPATGQTITSAGTAEIKITKKSGGKYDVAVKTKITGHPQSEDTTEYTLEGTELKLSDSTEMSGMKITTTASFKLSGATGSTLTGTVSTVGKIDGDTQTSSTMTFNLARQ